MIGQDRDLKTENWSDIMEREEKILKNEKRKKRRMNTRNKKIENAKARIQILQTM